MKMFGSESEKKWVGINVWWGAQGRQQSVPRHAGMPSLYLHLIIRSHADHEKEVGTFMQTGIGSMHQTTRYAMLVASLISHTPQ